MNNTINYLLQFTIYLLYIASIVFVILVTIMSLTESNIGISYSVILPLLVFLVSMFFCWYLEGVQQAANTANTIDDDVVEKLVGSGARLERIRQIREGYEAFSSARQLSSIVAIFSFKDSLAKLTPPNYSFSTLCSWVPNSSIACLDVGALLSVSWLQFVAAAAFTAWMLQLLPKRIARLDPIQYLSGLRLLFAGLVLRLGRIGLAAPTIATTHLVGKVLRPVPYRPARYPVSNLGILDELAKRLGYYAESLEIRVQFGDAINVIERVNYGLRQPDENEFVSLNKFVHRTNLTGRWSFENVIVTLSEEVGWSTDTSTRRITDYRTSQLKSSNVSTIEREDVYANQGAEDDVENLEGDDDATIARIKARTGRSFTRVKSEVALDQPISSESHPNFAIKLETQLIGSTSGVGEDISPNDESFQEAVSFLISIPVKHLRVVVCSMSEHIQPTGTLLKLVDVFEQESEERIDFTVLETEQLESGEVRGQYIDVRVPFIGSEVTVKTTV